MSIELDLDEIEAKWTLSCGACDVQAPMGCTCCGDDPRPVIGGLVDRVRELERKNLQQGMMLAGLLSKSDRDDAHIAELEGK